MTRYKAVRVIACWLLTTTNFYKKDGTRERRLLQPLGFESDTSKTQICEAKKDLERSTNSKESNLVAIGFRDS